jgi:hypothetical protein
MTDELRRAMQRILFDIAMLNQVAMFLGFGPVETFVLLSKERRGTADDMEAME